MSKDIFVFLLLNLVQLAFCSNVAGQMPVSLNSSESFNDAVLLMIQKQHDLCPYVPLCTKRNMSTYIVERSYNRIPCCSRCSCEETCIRNSTCCPDFVHQLEEVRKTENGSSESSETKGQCVRVQYGPMENNSGYKMIAACPNNYTNQTIIKRCNKILDYENVGTLTDHIPVFVRVSGQVYKNKYCFLCNAVNTTTAVFFDFMFNCTGELKTIGYPPPSPLELAVNMIKGRRCNIIFKINPEDKRMVNLKLVECHSDLPIIQSCKADYAGTDVEKLCNQYTWPVKMNKYSGMRLYKNYACMLCNDVSFKERCSEVVFNRVYVISLVTDRSEVLTSWESSDLDEESDNGLSTINRFFPDSSGNVICQKGFIFHRRTKTCRQILCPINFFIRNGTCTPLFDVLSGVAYMSHIEIIFPANVNGIETTDFEQAVLDAINQRFRFYIDNDDYMFSLWSNRQTPGNIDPSRKYYLVIVITRQDDYTAFIKFLHWFVILGSKIRVNVRSTNSVEIYLGLRFTDVSAIVRGEPVGPQGESLHLIKPKPWLKKLQTIEAMTRFVQVGKSLLCYRVALNFSEVEFKNSAVAVIETRNILTIPSFHAERSAVFVCVEDAFEGVQSVSKYILSSNAFMRKKNTLNSGDVDETVIHDGRKFTQDANNTLLKSLLITACTVAFIVVVICVKKCIVKYTKMHQGPILDNLSISHESSSEHCANKAWCTNRNSDICKCRDPAFTRFSNVNIQTKYVREIGKDCKPCKMGETEEKKDTENLRQKSKQKEKEGEVKIDLQEMNTITRHNSKIHCKYQDSIRSSDAVEPDEKSTMLRKENMISENAAEPQEQNTENQRERKQVENMAEPQVYKINILRNSFGITQAVEQLELNIENRSDSIQKKKITQNMGRWVKNREEINENDMATDALELSIEKREEINENDNATDALELSIEKREEINENDNATDALELSIEKREEINENDNATDALELSIEKREEINEIDNATDALELSIEKREEINENDNATDARELSNDTSQELYENEDVIDERELSIENREKTNENDKVTGQRLPSFEKREVFNRDGETKGEHELSTENKDEMNENDNEPETRELSIENREESLGCFQSTETKLV